MKAEDAIRESTQKTDVPSKAALTELKKLCAHNDAQTNHYRRVSRETAMELLTANGFPCHSNSRLDRVCRLLGRKSYVQK